MAYEYVLYSSDMKICSILAKCIYPKCVISDDVSENCGHWNQHTCNCLLCVELVF